MNYNKRVNLIKNVIAPGYLDDEIISQETEEIPCSISDVSLDEQLAVFGKYTNEAIKLHIQGYRIFDALEFDGVERSVYSIKRHRNSTVVIIT
ncbi:hypothetical protein [Enterococcus faecium]|uniref:hypothetical protein n=1 Tax=Enterococcus faecium TaxID=1352 RepID=UPI000BF0EB29|nr:hypothetical protein [Enterococcus faecium]PEH49307.1 hypothetical protein CRM75_16140 [Enterococcus faecium]